MWKKNFFAIGMLILFASISLAAGTDTVRQPVSSQEQPAVDEANNWLASVDSGRYASSWEDSCAYFKLLVTKDQWISQVSAARKAFGPVVSRKLDQKKYAKDLPGAPDGEYYVFGFQTAFDEKAVSFETLTLKKEKDGKWRVAGYYIR